jgi:hypothetical protein
MPASVPDPAVASAAAAAAAAAAGISATVAQPSGVDADGHLFVKFPRTHHLINPGGSAVARDDLLGMYASW